jgi:isochorismate pyruvate lyase
VTLRSPSDCRDLSQVRADIDALDDQLIALLARRVQYVECAAALKTGAGMPANAPDRVREVLNRVEAGARTQGLPADLAAILWRTMIDWAITHESDLMARARRDETD